MHTHLALSISRRDERLHLPLHAFAAILETAHSADTLLPLLTSIDIAQCTRVRTDSLLDLEHELYTAGSSVLKHHPVERITIHGQPFLALSTHYSSPQLATYLEFAHRLAQTAREHDRRIDIERRYLPDNTPPSPYERDLAHHLARRTYLLGETDLRIYRVI